MRHALVCCLAVLSLASCSASPPDTPAARSGSSAAPPAGPPRRATFEIGEPAPATVTLTGDRIASQVLQVPYAIPDPDTVVEATLKLYVTEIGDVVSKPVAPAAEGVAVLPIEPRAHSLGAHVRFRANCPDGVTDWHSLGQMPLGYQERLADVFRIGSVTPQSIPWSPAMDPSQGAAGATITIFGKRLTRDCMIETEVNRASVQLNNVHFYNGLFEGLLLFRDIGYAPVSPRYGELKLIVTRKSGQRLQAVRRISFAG